LSAIVYSGGAVVAGAHGVAGRSAAEADGAGHRLRPVLEARLHLVGAVACVIQEQRR